MVNIIIVIGNLGKDPEIRSLESGAKVAQFSLATNESFKNKQDEWENKTTWHNIVLWNRLAESAEKNLKKGMQVFIFGKQSNRKYEKDGVDKYISEIVARQCRRLGPADISNAPDTPEIKTISPQENASMQAKDDSIGGEDLPF